MTPARSEVIRLHLLLQLPFFLENTSPLRCGCLARCLFGHKHIRTWANSLLPLHFGHRPRRNRSHPARCGSVGLYRFYVPSIGSVLLVLCLEGKCWAGYSVIRRAREREEVRTSGRGDADRNRGSRTSSDLPLDDEPEAHWLARSPVSHLTIR